MSQNVFNTINPATTSGILLCTILNDLKEAFTSGQAGATRPTEIDEGGTWVDTSVVGILTLKMYDGITDIPILVVDKSTGLASAPSGGSIFTLLKQSEDAASPLLKFLKKRVTGGGQTLLNDSLGKIDFRGITNTAVEGLLAQIEVVTTETTTDASRGCSFVIRTTKTGTSVLSDALVIDGTGKLVLTNGFQANDFNSTTATVGTLNATTSHLGVADATSVTATGNVGGATVSSTGVATVGGVSSSENIATTKKVTATDNIESLAQVKGASADFTGDMASATIHTSGKITSTGDVESSGQVKGATGYFTGNLNVDGILVANESHLGTITETVDPSIAVNKTGNKATASSNKSGIEVTMTDSVSFRMGFDDTKTSKFVAGFAGSEKEIVNVDDTQTLKNKVLDDTNKFVDATDNTKVLEVDVGGTTGTKTTLTSAQTVNRVVTLPDETGTLASQTYAEAIAKSNAVKFAIVLS
jgi:hypothetical protein